MKTTFKPYKGTTQMQIEAETDHERVLRSCAPYGCHRSAQPTHGGETCRIKKLVGAYALEVGDTVSPADELMQAEALIRANLNLNPASLTPDQWARAFAQALWLENYRLHNIARLLSAMWNSGK